MTLSKGLISVLFGNLEESVFSVFITSVLYEQAALIVVIKQ